MNRNTQMSISAGKRCPLGMVILVFLVALAVTAMAQTADQPPGVSSEDSRDRASNEITNTFDWNSVASTEDRLARYDLRITKTSSDSSLLDKFIGGFHSIQLRAFQKPDGDLMVVSGVAFEVRQSDYSDLLSFRLGPWLESSLTEKILLHASGGLALGLLDASAYWNGASLLADSSLAGHNSRTYFEVAQGLYAGVDAVYRLSERWGIGIGAQFQNLIFSNRNISERPSSVDWSKCIMVQAGFTYRF